MSEITNDKLALVLTGGGARGAYQVGILRGLARHFPEIQFPLLTGVSAGAINTSSLACTSTALPEAAEALTTLWLGLSPERIFRVDSTSLVRNILRWGLRLISGGASAAPEVHGLLDTTPLRRFLTKSLPVSNGEIAGIAENLERGRLQAFAISTVSYSTGQTVT